MTAPNFTSHDDYRRMTTMIESLIDNKIPTLELFGDKGHKETTETNEIALADFLRKIHNDLGSVETKRTNYNATMSCNGEVLFSGLFNFTCFNNFALLLWHNASHANVTWKKELIFDFKPVDDSLVYSPSYKSPYCWE